MIVLSVILVILVVFVIHFPSFTYAQDIRSLFYTPSDAPFGVPYGVWIQKYWDWWGNIPKVSTPTENEYTCYMKDVGNVIFLVNPLKMNDEVTYSCQIPPGKPLFFALVTSEYDTGTDGYEHATDKQLVDAARMDDNSNAFMVTLDGKVIPSNSIRDMRAESPFWNITMVQGNHYDSKPGVFRAVAEGFFAFVKPLPTGHHQLYYETSSPKQDLQVSPGGKITYNLFVNSTAT